MRIVDETHQDKLKLLEYLSRKAAGSVLDYKDIESDTGVRMDVQGKARLRGALKHAKRDYSAVRGFGVKLASPETVVPILSGRIRRIDNAVRRADKSQKRLQEQFFRELTEEDQRKVLFAGALFGAIRLAAEQGRNIQRKPISAPTLSIPLPVVS